MRTAVASPEPEPASATGGTVTWTWTEPNNCYFAPATRDTARTASILNAALAWYGNIAKSEPVKPVDNG